jgi:hypothetical protein
LYKNRPSTGGIDAGDNTLSPDGRFLTEVGVYDNYLEIWERISTDSSADDSLGDPLVSPSVPHDGRRYLACTLVHEDRKGFLVVIGSTFAIAMGRPSSSVVSTVISNSLLSILESYPRDVKEEIISDYECVVGTIVQQSSTCSWVIKYSTKYDLEGTETLPPSLPAGIPQKDVAVGMCLSKDSYTWLIQQCDNCTTRQLFA